MEDCIWKWRVPQSRAKHGILEYSIFKQTYVYATPKTIEKTIPTKIVVKYGQVNTMFEFFGALL